MSEKKNIIQRRKEEKKDAYFEGMNNYEAWIEKCGREPWDCSHKLAQIECSEEFKGKLVKECNKGVSRKFKASELETKAEGKKQSKEEAKIERAKIKAEKEKLELEKKLERIKSGKALPEDIELEEEEEEEEDSE